MRMLTVVLLLLSSVSQVASLVPDVTIKKVDVEEEDSKRVVSILVRNTSKETIKVLEVNVCYSEKYCERNYLTGRFMPAASSWSNELSVRSRIITSLTLVRIQSVED